MPRAYFDDFQPGQDWGANIWTPTEELCRRWSAAGVGAAPQQNGARRNGREADGGSYVPPSLIFVALSQCIQDRLRDKPPGGVHAKQQLAFHAPIFAGDTLETRIKVKTKYLKRERKYVEFETETINQDGVTVVSGVRTTIWAA